MAKKGKFKPRTFERDGNGNLSATIYANMLQSAAWMGLSKQAQVLYLYMKLQLYGQKRLEGYGEDCFIFSKKMYTKIYELYKNGEQFNRDKQQLIRNGFIDEVLNGKHTREENVYRYSDRWKEYRKPQDNST